MGENIVVIARIAIFASPILSLLYTLFIGIFAIYYPSIPTGSLLGGTIYLFPLALATAFAAYKWPFAGSISAIILGIIVVYLIASATGWPAWYKVPYLTFSAIFVGGGILELASFALRMTHQTKKGLNSNED